MSNGMSNGQEECRGIPRVGYSRTYQLIHNNVADEDAVKIFRVARELRRTVGWSADDAGIGDLDDRTVEVFGWPSSEHVALVDWYATHYPGVSVLFKSVPSNPITAGMNLLGDFGRRVTGSTPTPVTDTDDCRGVPRVGYSRTFQLLHNSLTDAQSEAIFRDGLAERRTTGWSFDDAGIGDLDNRTVELFGLPEEDEATITAWYAEHYPGVVVQYLAPPVGVSGFWLASPTNRNPQFMTDPFNSPRDYDGDGVFDDLHEGVDFAGLHANGQLVDVLAAQSGTVFNRVSRETGYGNFLVLEHQWPDGEVYRTWYTHLSQMLVNVGESVAQGQKIGVAGDVGNTTGPHLHFNLQHIGKGLSGYVIPDIVDPMPFFSDEPPPPPPAGNAQLGLHASADPTLANGELALFTSGRIDLIKVLSNLDPADVLALVNARPNARWIVRAFLDFGGRTITPQQFVQDTISDVQRTLNILAGKQVVVELHNEPNLQLEGLGTSWSNGTSFSNWFRDVLSRYQAALPGVVFIYPGLSPGNSIVGVRQDDVSFLDQSMDSVRASDGFGQHLYWGAIDTLDDALAKLDSVISALEAGQAGDKAIWITEASNKRPGGSGPEQGNSYIEFWQGLKERSSVEGVTFFVASASNQEFAQEAWVANGTSRGIAEVVGSRED